MRPERALGRVGPVVTSPLVGGPSQPQVTVCVITYRRPQALRALLAGLARQRGTMPLVIVVDNDPAMSAYAVSEASPIPVHYAVEPTPGVSAPRNRALQLAADADLVAFIDDDEVPDDDWLACLLRAVLDHDAQVVQGRVCATYPPGTPTWVTRGGFFDRPRLPSGSTLYTAATNNVIMHRAVLERVGRFDERFGLSGGEDSHLFLRARQAGFRIVYCDEAVVREEVPVDRMTARWLCRRAFRQGGTKVLIERDVTPGAPRLIRRMLAVPAALLQALALIVGALPARRRHQAVAGLARGAEGLGMLAGLFGHHASPYARPRPKVAHAAQ